MTLWVVYPALALVLGVLTSIYLFVAWFRHPKKRPAFILYWSAGLFLMYWFQVPIILTNLGRTTTITAFNFFFAVTFPVTFLALAMIYWGVLDALNIRLNRMLKVLFLAWLLSAAAFFAYHFIIYHGVISTHILPVVGNLVFYLPLRILIIIALARRVMQMDNKKNLGAFGAAFVIGESVLGIFRNLLIVKYVLAYPPQLWYIVLTSLKIFFILQTASIIFLVFGFIFLHRACCRTGN
ncbi:MAG: hypothetical protein UW30_C0017G0021 [Candidatus Giovannonibacteria bacterium GW2011_GWA2_44_13b]|uniref:Histidine kinase N-terminal 7TM region domain-containing protein n=2 Tax=Candidatus Giovannoniibacteriota TaxID=1752738 RepID=A0A0G1H0C7_9BACT|nr:MAG: hypothetical protein UW30_C0017G0021 [Candidatus Giovannonibacteria bacterium GW2011_GWA2_44_13b]OGF82015.1 MAG: hypothetical protein A2924_00225 [Candidatus Giovannonibacteria bacterium RIFCSPLOWO2_01_FULL_44_16]